MPITPRPRTYCCPACHWSRTVAPRSDVRIRGIDHFDCCPACGHQPLETKAASTAQVMLAEVADRMKRFRA